MLGPGLHFLSGAPPEPCEERTSRPTLPLTWILPKLLPLAAFGLVRLQCRCLLPSPLSYLVRPGKRGTFAEEPSPRSVSKALPRQFTLLTRLLKELKLKMPPVHPSWGGPRAMSSSVTVELHFPAANTATEAGHERGFITHLVWGLLGFVVRAEGLPIGGLVN